MNSQIFYEFNLYIIFKNFHENSHCRSGRFQENRESHIKGEFVKIGEFTLVLNCVIIPENGNLGLKMKNLKFLGIQPIFSLNGNTVDAKKVDAWCTLFIIGLK